MRNALHDEGDCLFKSREIQHWVFFKDEKRRSAFNERVVQLGFSIDMVYELEDESRRFVTCLKKDDSPLNTIDDSVRSLVRLCNDCDAFYDGWETQVTSEEY